MCKLEEDIVVSKFGVVELNNLVATTQKKMNSSKNMTRNGKYGNELVAPDAHAEQLDDNETHNSRETQSENSSPSQ